MLRPRTNQVVSIIDELMRQSGTSPASSPMMSPAFRSSTGLQQAMNRPELQFSQPSASTMTATYPTGPVGTTLASTTPQMQNRMQGQMPLSMPQEQVGSVTPPTVVPRRGDIDMGGRGMLKPGADVMGMKDLAQKAEQARQIEATNPELKTDPTFQERISGFFGNRENMLRLALGFNTMRLKPDQGLASAIQSELKDLRTQNRATNVAARLRQIGTPAAIRAAEYIESTGDAKGGMTMYNKAGSVEQKTGAELGGAAAGYDPNKVYNVNTLTGQVSGVGGGTEINIEGDKSKLFDAEYKYIADNKNTYINEGKQAQTQLQAFGRMNRALDFTDTGREEANRQAIRTMLDGFGLSGLIDETAYANAASFNAAANALVAEELRANKGPQTDFDARFAQTYIPGLSNPKEANREILKYGQSTAQIKKLLGIMATRIRPGSGNVFEEMEEVNNYALTVPNVVVRADGTVVHFYDFYRQNRTAEVSDLFEAWTTYADRERARQLEQ